MGRKLDALLGKTFRSSKCKTLLKLTVSRIKLLKNKRELQCKQARKDVAQLLQNGQEASARLRVEHVLREQNMLDAYLLIEGYCYAVAERILSIEKQKTCPNDMKESIASLVFAAPRCADLPELQDVRSLFAAKYGKEFITAAIELHPDCGVSRQIIEKLSTRVPSAEVKLGLMKEIAVEHGIEWDFEKSESEMLKPEEDLLNGPQQLFGAGKRTPKPVDDGRRDSVPETTKASNEPNERSPVLSQAPAALSQPTSSAYYSQPSSSTSPSNVRAKDQQQFVPFAVQGHGKLSNAEMHDSAPLHAPSHGKDEPVASPKSEIDIHSNASDDGPYTSTQMEGPKQESIMYTDVASAAQAAFESAAYAAAAARAAVDLARRESAHKNLSQRADEVSSESEDDQLDEIISRQRTEGKDAKSDPRLGRDIKEPSSAKDEEAYGIKGSRTIIHEVSDGSSVGSAFERIHPSQKSGSDSESGEGPLEEQASWSKDGRSSVHKSNQPHFDVYDDDHKEYESNALFESRKLNNKQEYTERSRVQLKRSMSGSASNSSDQFSPCKASQPLFDNYGDDEDEYQKVPSGKLKFQSTFKDDRRSKNENFHDRPLRYTDDRKWFDDHDEDDSYEMVGMRRKEDQKQDYMNETERIPNNLSVQVKPRPTRSSEDKADLVTRRSALRPIKSPSRDFVQQEIYSAQNLEPQSDDDDDEVVEPLNDKGFKFQYDRKMEMPVLKSSQLGDDRPPPPVRQGMREGMLSNGTKISDSEGIYRHEGDGKLRWRPANPEEQQQHISASAQSTESAPRRDNRMSVRTWRAARQKYNHQDEDEPVSNTTSNEFPSTLTDDDLSARFEALRRRR